LRSLRNIIRPWLGRLIQLILLILISISSLCTIFTDFNWSFKVWISSKTVWLIVLTVSEEIAFSASEKCLPPMLSVPNMCSLMELLPFSCSHHLLYCFLWRLFWQSTVYYVSIKFTSSVLLICSFIMVGEQLGWERGKLLLRWWLERKEIGTALLLYR
jgi:hypothetical protein